MTGFNHAATGALITVLVNPVLAVPLAFASHFVLDAIPHFGWEFNDDVFKRNRTKTFRAAVALETILVSTALIFLPIILRPTVDWWITLLVMLSALFMDLVWVYRGIREEITKKVKPRNKIMNIHLNVSHHHPHFPLGTIFELLYFAVALSLILLIAQ